MFMIQLPPLGKLIVSSDSLGAPQNLDTFRKVWEPLDQRIAGVELLGIGSASCLKDKINDFKKEVPPVAVIGIHGRTGTIRTKRLEGNLVLLAARIKFLETKMLLQQFSSQVSYILFHSPELENQQNVTYLLEHKEELPCIMLENHVLEESWQHVQETVARLYDQGLPVGLMIDTAHLFFDLPRGSLQTRWNYVLQKTEEACNHFSKKIPIGVHLPFGLNRHDSVPIDKELGENGIALEDLLRLSEVLNEANVRIRVLENQQLRVDRVFGPRNGGVEKQRVRNAMILDLFSRAKLIW